MTCPDCDGTGWFWGGPTFCLDGIVRLLGWIACASCNDDAVRPKPARPGMSLEALN